MKKIIAIISALLITGILVFFGITLFKSANVETIEIVGDVQTVYFVNSSNAVNFNDADLKITYKDGTVKLKKLTKDLVKVKNFNTSVVNNGIMKITYKSNTIDVGYSVVFTGLYYLSDYERQSYDASSSSLVPKTSATYICGVDSKTNVDKTTTKEMIYFHSDGSCDYYSRTTSLSNWFMDDGYYNKSFNYSIGGNNVYVNLGDEKRTFTTSFSNDGELSLVSVDKVYVDETSSDPEFLQSKTTRVFKHYEMKNDRTFGTEDISVTPSDIRFKRNSEFSDSTQKIYIKVNYTNDTFLSTVYVRFNETMFYDKFDTKFDTSLSETQTYKRCKYNGVFFTLYYTVEN